MHGTGAPDRDAGGLGEGVRRGDRARWRRAAGRLRGDGSARAHEVDGSAGRGAAATCPRTETGVLMSRPPIRGRQSRRPCAAGRWPADHPALAHPVPARSAYVDVQLADQVELGDPRRRPRRPAPPARSRHVGQRPPGGPARLAEGGGEVHQGRPAAERSAEVLRAEQHLVVRGLRGARDVARLSRRPLRRSQAERTGHREGGHERDQPGGAVEGVHLAGCNLVAAPDSLASG